MQTEFTCGIYTATFREIALNGWDIKTLGRLIARVDNDGLLIRHFMGPVLSAADLLEIAVLMNNIKRQHQQLQTIS